jgi:hypothetical protein
MVNILQPHVVNISGFFNSLLFKNQMRIELCIK